MDPPAERMQQNSTAPAPSQLLPLAGCSGMVWRGVWPWGCWEVWLPFALLSLPRASAALAAVTILRPELQGKKMLFATQ